MKSNLVRLSYILSPDLSAYGDGDRIVIDHERSIVKGDTSNNTKISLSSHFGTHIDFPLHFIQNGRAINSYELSEFIFSKILIIDISHESILDYIIGSEVFENINSDPEIEIIILYTGFSLVRDKEKYWKENYGLSPQIPTLLEGKFPGLRAIGFDLISLSSFQRRELGRKAHQEFLSRDILIIEDMDLHSFERGNMTLKKIIVIPLFVDQAEGCPVTVIGVYDD
jgi:arylformamidase